MPIDSLERYKLIFGEHQHASDIRMKILEIWGLIYAALAAVFGWAYSASPVFSWIVPALALFATILMWIADSRNRDALRSSKDVGAEIERDTNAGIPENQRYFDRLARKSFFERVVTHSFAIDAFSILMILLLLIATFYLFSNKGILPK